MVVRLKIYKCKDNLVEKKNYLYEGLGLDLSKKYIISFVGGGGKTSSIYNLAEELSNCNKKVIVTTTTHMQMLKGKIILNDNICEIKSMLSKNDYITVGIKTKDDKITSVSEDKVRELSNICDFLLIEADGAKMLPLKAPASHEPVILEISNMVVGVCGIDALNKSIGDTCHRAQIVSELLNKDLESLIEVKDISYILSSKSGQMKDVKTNMEYRVIINKVDDNLKLEQAVLIAKELEDKNIEAIMTSYR